MRSNLVCSRIEAESCVYDHQRLKAAPLHKLDQSFTALFKILGGLSDVVSFGRIEDNTGILCTWIVRFLTCVLILKLKRRIFGARLALRQGV